MFFLTTQWREQPDGRWWKVMEGCLLLRVMREVPHNVHFTTTVRSLCVAQVFSHNFMQFFITWLRRCFSPCPVLCQSCMPLLPFSQLRKWADFIQIICFYGTAVNLDLCSYHCQSSSISGVYSHQQIHPVWSYSSSRLLLHNKTDNLSLTSLQKGSFWQWLQRSFCCI